MGTFKGVSALLSLVGAITVCPSTSIATPIMVNPGPLGAITSQLNIDVLAGVSAALGTVGDGETFSFDFLFNGKAIKLGSPRNDLFSQLEIAITPQNPAITTQPVLTAIYLLDQNLSDLGVGYTSASATHYGYGMVWNQNSSGANVSGETFYGLHVEGTLPIYSDGMRTITSSYIKFGPFATFDPNFYGTIIEADIVEPVPEPGTVALLGIGVAGLAASRMRRRPKTSARD